VHYSSLFQYFFSIYYGPYSIWKFLICDRILENLPFWHIDWSDIIIHIYKEKEALFVKFQSKKLVIQMCKELIWKYF